MAATLVITSYSIHYTKLYELKQPQYSPMAVEDQVVAIFLGTKGHLDSVPVADVGRFESSYNFV